MLSHNAILNVEIEAIEKSKTTITTFSPSQNYCDDSDSADPA